MPQGKASPVRHGGGGSRKRWKGRFERLGKINKGLLHVRFVQQPLFMFKEALINSAPPS